MDIEYDAEKSDIYSDELKLDVSWLKPIITELIWDVKGKKVLDFGCGNDRFSKMMAETGASITAMDVSSHRIKLARRINTHENIIYKVGNQSDLAEFREKSFDLVLLNMVFPSMSTAQKKRKIS